MSDLKDFDIIKETCGALFLPKTPAHWLGDEPEYRKISRVEMTCGGGMGGCHWYEYINRGEMQDVTVGGVKMLECTRWNGKKVTINPQYVVAIEDYTLLLATYYSRNPNYPTGEYTVKYLAQDWQTVELVNDWR